MSLSKAAKGLSVKKTATKGRASPPSSDRRKAIERFFARRKLPVTYAEIGRGINVVTSGPDRDSISSTLRTLVRNGFLVRTSSGTYQRATAISAPPSNQTEAAVEAGGIA